MSFQVLSPPHRHEVTRLGRAGPLMATMQIAPLPACRKVSTKHRQMQCYRRSSTLWERNMDMSRCLVDLDLVCFWLVQFWCYFGVVRDVWVGVVEWRTLFISRDVRNIQRKGVQKYQKCNFIFHDMKSYDLYVATYACLWPWVGMLKLKQPFYSLNSTMCL